MKKLFTPYTELLWVLAFFFLGALVGCGESFKPSAEPSAETVPIYKYEDKLVRIESNRPEGIRHWHTISIVEDKATGARVFCVFNTSGSCVAVCPLPPLPQAPLEGKTP